VALTTIADVRTLLLNEYNAAAAAFGKTPNAMNWMSLKRAMLHHQQAWQLREAYQEHQQFAASLGGVSDGEWGRKVVEFKNPGDSYEQLVEAST